MAKISKFQQIYLRSYLVLNKWIMYDWICLSKSVSYLWRCCFWSRSCCWYCLCSCCSKSCCCCCCCWLGSAPLRHQRSQLHLGHHQCQQHQVRHPQEALQPRHPKPDQPDQPRQITQVNLKDHIHKCKQILSILYSSKSGFLITGRPSPSCWSAYTTLRDPRVSWNTGLI